MAGRSRSRSRSRRQKSHSRPRARSQSRPRQKSQSLPRQWSRSHPRQGSPSYRGQRIDHSPNHTRHERHIRNSRRYDSDSSEDSHWSSATDGTSDSDSMTGPMNLLDGFNATLIGMVARTQHPDPELEYEYELERKKSRPSRPPSSRRRRDDPSVLSRISDATMIRSGVMTKEQIPVCSATKYGSDLPCDVVPMPRKGLSILRGRSGTKGRNARPSFKHQDSCSEGTVVSTVTESPMPINVSSIYSSAEWKRKFREKEEAKAAAAGQMRGGRKNNIHTVDPTSPQPRHYYIGLRSTKNPLGKKPNINAKQSMILSSYRGSDLTSHHLNSLPSSRFPRHHRAENKHSKSSMSGSAYDSETIESGSVAKVSSERESAGRSFNEPSLLGMGHRQVSSISTFGPNQSTILDKYGHRYGNYSFPEKSEADGTASTHPFSNNMLSGSTSISSRSVRIRTKRRGEENDVVELELLPEERSFCGDSNNDDGSSSTDANIMDDKVTELALPDDDDVNDVVHIDVGEASGSAEARGKPKVPIVVNVQPSGFVSTCTSRNSSSVASSASSQITSNRSGDTKDKPSLLGALETEVADADSSPPDHTSNDRAGAVVDVLVPSPPDAGSAHRKQAGAAPLSSDSTKKREINGSNSESTHSQQEQIRAPRYKNLSSDLNVGSEPLTSYPEAQGGDCGDIDKYQAPDEVSTASSSTAASSTCSAASSSDEAQYLGYETQRNANGAVEPVSNTDKIIVMQSVEDDVLAPTYAPMQNDTLLVQDKRDQDKQSGFVKETVENMLESAFSPDGENNRSYDNVGKRTRTLRPKIPLFDSMTSSESSGQGSKDWHDVESWCRGVPENSVRNRPHYERRIKYPSKKNRAGWYARPTEEIKNGKGVEVDVIQVGLRKKRMARSSRGQRSW